jgi:hypothetical protein
LVAKRSLINDGWTGLNKKHRTGPNNGPGQNGNRPLSGQRRQPSRAARVKPFTITGYSLDDLAAALGLD